jgi:uroporphyrinogen decarboxylase
VTGIHVVAYRNLRKALGFPDGGIEFCDAVQQLASIDDDVVARMNIDTRGLYPLNSHNWKIIEEDAGDYWAYHDEWGITHHRPKDDGLYYSVVKVPLPRSELTVADISNHPWPDVANPERLAGLCDLARQYRDAGYAVVLKDAFAGIFEFAQRIVGMENLLVMMITNEKVTCALFDRLLQLKLDYWQTALAELGDLVDVVTYADDYGTQASQLISPDMFRRLIKPRLKVLFETFIKYAPHAKRFFHSDGNVRPLIPDLLEIGVEILNPIHIRAQSMAPAGLKRDYGKDLAFWGGGVDTQGILPRGAPQEVKDDVRRNIEALAPGGGYVFNTIHNIQADVPPQNLIAMWEALQEYGVY